MSAAATADRLGHAAPRRRRLGPAPLVAAGAADRRASLLLPLAFVGVQASSAGWTSALHLLRAAARRRAAAQHARAGRRSCRRLRGGRRRRRLAARAHRPARPPRLGGRCSCCRSRCPSSSTATPGCRSTRRVHGLLRRRCWSATLSYYPLVYAPGDRDPAAQRRGARGRRAQPGARLAGAVFRRVTLPQLRLAAARRRPDHRAAPAGRVRRLRAAPASARSRRRSTPSTSSASTRPPRRCSRSCSSALCLLAAGARSRACRAAARRPTSAAAHAPPALRLGLARPCPRSAALGGLAALGRRRPGRRARLLADRGAPPRRCPRPRSPAPPSRRSALGSAAALITTLAAVPVAVLAVRYPTRLARLLERSAYIARAHARA